MKRPKESKAFVQLCELIIPLCYRREIIEDQLDSAGLKPYHFYTDGVPAIVTRRILRRLCRAKQFRELSLFCNFDVDRSKSQKIRDLIATIEGKGSAEQREAKMIVDCLREGNFHRAFGLLRRYLPEQPPENGPEGTRLRFSERQIAACAMDHLCEPRRLLSEELQHPPYGEAGSPHTDRLKKIWDTITILDFARPLFNQWGCADAEREADLLCHRLRFVLARHSGRPSQGLCPYQSVVRYMRTGHPSTSARIAVLWAAGLTWEALRDPWRSDEKKKQFPPGQEPVGWKGVREELKVAHQVLREIDTPEDAIRSLLDDFERCLGAIIVTFETDASPGIDLPSKRMEAERDSDLDVWLIDSFAHPADSGLESPTVDTLRPPS
jgi:hypothetical protein